ncbi:bZIP transcription factor 44 [Sesamum angolense]|uniref:BZIP transcription factor 44 n=1 Tax=Sesamum angolense TaxID=2727404 RepID=A0AAE2BR16_9LAMI|nr:bZIP transcription factor 44 [Sesamum angolense]
MASLGGTCSGSSSDQENHQNLTTEIIRKRKRMISNRESARRSRMRKQKHLDDLTAQAANLRAENNHILTNINHVTQMYLNVEADNSVLRAQISELNHRLKSLTDIISCMRLDGAAFDDQDFGDNYDYDYDHDQMIGGGGDLFSPWSLVHVKQPIMASSDHGFMY